MLGSTCTIRAGIRGFPLSELAVPGCARGNVLGLNSCYFCQLPGSCAKAMFAPIRDNLQFRSDALYCVHPPYGKD